MTPSGGEIRAMPIMRGADKTARTLSATFEKCYDKKKKRTSSRLLRHCTEVWWHNEKRHPGMETDAKDYHQQRRKEKKKSGSGCAVEDFTRCVPLWSAYAEDSSTLSQENRRSEQVGKNDTNILVHQTPVNASKKYKVLTKKKMPTSVRKTDAQRHA